MRTVLVVRSTGDEALDWAEALSNDADAFAAIFDRHHDRVYRHALRLTENLHDAEDITAGAFLELWRRRKSVRVVGGSTLPWLLVTATNLSRNLTRGLHRYRMLIATLPRAEVGRSAEDAAEERIEDARLATQVREALALCHLLTLHSSRSHCSSTIRRRRQRSHLASPVARPEPAYTVRDHGWLERLTLPTTKTQRGRTADE